jgi:hypothetical protein
MHDQTERPITATATETGTGAQAACFLFTSPAKRGSKQQALFWFCGGVAVVSSVFVFAFQYDRKPHTPMVLVKPRNMDSAPVGKKRHLN